MTSVQFIARMLLAAVFLAASSSKGMHSGGFIKTVRRIGIRSRAASLLAWLVITYEAALGLCLALGIFPTIVASAALLLLFIFLGVSTRAIFRRQNIPCNCFGRATSSLGSQTLKHALILIIPVGAYLLSTFFVHSTWWPNTFEKAISSLSLVIAVILIGRWLLIAEDLVTLIGERHKSEEKIAQPWL